MTTDRSGVASGFMLQFKRVIDSKGKHNWHSSTVHLLLLLFLLTLHILYVLYCTVLHFCWSFCCLTHFPASSWRTCSFQFVQVIGAYSKYPLVSSFWSLMLCLLVRWIHYYLLKFLYKVNCTVSLEEIVTGIILSAEGSLLTFGH